MKYFYLWMLTLFCSGLAFGQLTEDFESDITANGWSLFSTESFDPGFLATTARSHTGAQSYYHNDDNIAGVSTSFMVSPQYTVQAGDSFSVYVNQNYSDAYYEYSGIMISTASGDPIANSGDFVELFELGENFAEDEWVQVFLDLSAYEGQNVYFAFKYTGDFNHEFYVDDMYVGAACDLPVATASLVPLCETGQFSVDLDITSLGTATSVLITDNFGNSATVSDTGVQTFGPYESGSSVNITLADADNLGCSTLLTQSYYCPPLNDDCADATVVTEFPYNETGTALGSTQTENLTCGIRGMNDGTWYSFEGESAQYTINLTSTGWDAALGIFTGSCTELECLVIRDVAATNGQETYTFVGQAGVTYYVNIGHYSATSDQPEGEFILEILSEEIPCNGPSNLAVAAVTDLSADASWQANEENASYDLIWGETGFTPGANASVSGLTGTTYQITQLTPETEYDLYVRGNCEPGYSDWIGPITFTTLEEGAILPGTDCAHPINVTGLPYSTTDNTSNYGDDYDGSPGATGCGTTTSYIGGDDVVYAYTPAEDTSIDISMTPGGSWSGIFVYESCNDIGSVCYAGIGNSTTNARVIDNLLVTGGQTYYIVISTWPSPQSVAYDLLITENTCVDGTFEISAVGACETSEFMVELEVTDMGSLTSYEVSDDQEGTVQTITAPGTYTFGPYPSLTTVNFTLAANDSNCDTSASIYYACPPLNDECSDAISLPVNPTLECTDSVSGSVSGATDSMQDSCFGTPDDDIWYSFVATETVHLISLFNIANGTTDLYHAVYSGSCGELVNLECSDPNDSTVEGLTPGETYYVQVFTYSSTAGQTTSFDICVKTLPDAEPNDDCNEAVELTVGTEFATNPVTSSNAGATTMPGMPAPGCASFQGGEMWFTAVAPETGHIIFESNPVDGGGITDTGMAVYTGSCDGLVLLDCDDDSSSSGLFSMIELENQTPGTVYYIAVWEYGNNAMGSFQVSAYDNFTCIPPQITHEPVLDCESESYSFTVNITDLGSAEELSIVNSLETESIVVTGPGTYTFGPYSFGESANVNIETGDAMCNTSFTYGYSSCPPENDVCSTAIAVGVNEGLECVEVVSGTINEATESGIDSCFGTPDDDVWFSFVATAESHLISLTNVANGTSDLYHAVYSGACGALVNLVCSDPNDSTVTGLTPGETYYVQVFSWTSTANQTTTFDLCIKTMPDAPDNDECDDAFVVPVNDTLECNEFASGTIASATNSEIDSDCSGTADDDVWFSFVAEAETHLISLLNITGGTTDLYHAVYSGACGELTNMICSDPNDSTVEGLTIGETYFIQVYSWTSTVNQTTTFDVCIKTLPEALENDECDGAIDVPVNADFSCEQIVSGHTIGATASAQTDDVVGTPNNDVWFSFVATSDNHRIALQNVVNLGGGATGTDMAFGVYDATNGCEALTLVDDSDPNTLNISGLTVGTTYLIRVYNYGATPANVSFDICIGTPPASDYDIECGTPLEMSYCYDSNENFTWTFNSTTDEAVTFTFTSGSVEDNFDIITVYDGTDSSGTLLWDSYNANPSGSRFILTGTTFTATSGSLHFVFDSDGSISCQQSTDVDTWEFSVNCGVDLPSVDWANLQHPPSGAISAGEEFMVYGQVYAEGVTEAEGPGEGIEAWVGYSTTDTDPSTWENWIPATFNVQVGNNDEYMANLGAEPLSGGTYYYATRYRLDFGTYYYGGYNGGAWDGVTNVSGVLTVSGPDNDDCLDATELSVGTEFGTSPEIVSNVGASDFEGMPAPECGSYQGGEIWLMVTVPDSGEITIETNPVDGGGITDTAMAVYSGSCDGLTLIECDDDSSDSGFFSMIHLTDQTPGTVLYVAVWEYGNNATGTFAVSAYSNSMSVSDLNNVANVKMYPNPTTDVLNITGIDVKDVQVYSASGQLAKVRLTGNVVDARSLPTGTYVIRITDNEGNIVLKKFIKK